MNIYLKLRESAKSSHCGERNGCEVRSKTTATCIADRTEDKLADAILNGEIQEGDHVAAGASKKGIHFVKTES